MLLNPEEIFADLINFRKEINAPECHFDYSVKPFHFVIYSPSSTRFHFMPCPTVRTANNNGTISNFRRTSKADASQSAETVSTHGTISTPICFC